MRTSYGFYVSDAVPGRLYRLRSIGCGVAQDGSYGQDGMKRPLGGHLFQYTLSGEGAVTIGGETFRVPKQHGFFVTIPSDHRYFYPPDGVKPWEFMWIFAAGGEMADYWQHFTRSFGPVASFREDAEPIRLMRNMCREAGEPQFRDKYGVSLRLFEWLLSFERLAEGHNRGSEPMPDSLRRAKRFMERHFADPISLDDVAAAAGMSKHHFCKVFKAYAGVTPMHYLRKIRVEEAAMLLRNTTNAIEAIALQTGFDNISYFGKVFRQFIGVTPSDFRKGLLGSHDSRQLRIVD